MTFFEMTMADGKKLKQLFVFAQKSHLRLFFGDLFLP